MSKTIFALLLAGGVNVGLSVASLIYLCMGAQPELCKFVAATCGIIGAALMVAIGIIGERQESWRQ